MPRRSVFEETLFAPPDPGLEKREKRWKMIKIIGIPLLVILAVGAGYYWLVVPLLK